MTPEELAARHPRLYHLTLPCLLPSIEQHGLWSAAALIDGSIADPAARAARKRTRRKAAEPLDHLAFGQVILNDQTPLSESKLERCLEGGLTPADWLEILNARVFLWSSEHHAKSLLGARANRSRAVVLLQLDTLRLAQAHASAIEICPINSGATIRKPARRGATTFTPLTALSYGDWSRRRGMKDTIKEVTVLGGVRCVARYITARTYHGPV